MFYGTNDGNRLVDETNYPQSIKDYLEKEGEILNQKVKKH